MAAGTGSAPFSGWHHHGETVIVPAMTHFFRTVLCLSLALVAGCSSYDRRFAEASRGDGKRTSCEGTYSGRWTSASHPGGGGNLRCILTKVDGTHSDYRADFHATWHGFASEHAVVLHTKSVGRKKAGGVEFEGTSKLRTIIGAGTYTCKGSLDSRTMRACYDATYDRGTFEMMRAVPKDGTR